MLKKFKYLLIGILLFLPVKTKALTGKFGIHCDNTTLNIGSTTKCLVSGKVSNPLKKLSFSVSKSDNISVSKLKSSMNPYGVNGLYIEFYGSGPFDMESIIASFDITINSESSNSYVGLSNIKAISSSGYDSYSQDSVIVNITIPTQESEKTPEVQENIDTNTSSAGVSSTTTIDNKTSVDTTIDDNSNNKPTSTNTNNIDTNKKIEVKKENNSKKEVKEQKTSEIEEKKEEVENQEQLTTTTGPIADTKTVVTTEKTTSKSNSSNKNIILISIVSGIIFIGIVVFVIYIKIKTKKA